MRRKQIMVLYLLLAGTAYVLGLRGLIIINDVTVAGGAWLMMIVAMGIAGWYSL